MNLAEKCASCGNSWLLMMGHGGSTMALILVGDVDRDSTEANVRSLFEAYGVVANVSFVSDFAFVEMPDAQAAQKAISDLNWQGNWMVRPVVHA